MFVSALMPDEKETVDFSKEQLQQIKETTGLVTQDINAIILHYKYYKGIHGYLYSKKLKGEHLPEDGNQLRQFLLLERPDFIMDMNREKHEKSRKEKYEKLTRKMKQKEAEREQKEYLNRVKTWQI